MSETGDDSESQNRGGDEEAGGDGIPFDIFYELVFDSLGVRLKSEDEAWEADADEV